MSRNLKRSITSGTIQALLAASARRDRPQVPTSRHVRTNVTSSGAKRSVRGATQPDGAAEVTLYGVIGSDIYSDDGGITTKSISRQLDSAGSYSSIRLRINSPGGDVFEGITILNWLRAQGKPIECCVDGIAASAASIIAMAGDVITMGSGAMIMVHNAWSICIGDASAMDKEAEVLGEISKAMATAYSDRTGMTVSDAQSLMDAETWMGADECLDLGFCTAIATQISEEEERSLATARSFAGLNQFRNVPARLKGRRPVGTKTQSSDECECDCEACADGRCDECTDPDCTDPNCVDCPAQNSEGKAIARMAAVIRSPAASHCDLQCGPHILAMRKFSTAKLSALVGTGQRVSGIAAPFNSLSSDLGGFREIYNPGCFAESLKAGDDARVLFNHNVDDVLGRRSAGTARFWEDATGLRYEADLPDTNCARDLATLMRRGDIREASAAFYILKHRYEQRSGERVRVIEKAMLVEVSPHTFAAYAASSAGLSATDPDYWKARIAAVRESITPVDPETAALKAKLECLKRR